MGTGVGEAAAAEAVKTGGEAAAAEGGKAAGEAALAEGGAAGLGEAGLGATVESGIGAGLGEAALGAGEAGLGGLGLESALTGVGEADLFGTVGSGIGDAAGLGAGGLDAASIEALGGAAPEIGAGSAEIAGGAAPTFDIGTTPESILNPTLQEVAPVSVEPPGMPGTPATSMSQKLMDQLMNNKGTAAALGLNAYSQFAQRGKGTAGQLKDLAKPFSNAGADLLDQYKSGKLNPNDEFNINQWQQQQIAKSNAAFAKSGQGDSSAARAAAAKITQQAQAMRDQALQGLLDNGLKASGMAVGPLTNAITAQAQQDQQFAQSQQSALNALLLLQAMGSKTPATAGAGT